MSQIMKSSIFYLVVDLLLILAVVYQTNNNLKHPTEGKLSGMYYTVGISRDTEDSVTGEKNKVVPDRMLSER